MPSEFGHYESKFAKTMDTRDVQTAPGNSRMSKTQSVTLLSKTIPPRTASGKNKPTTNI